MWFFHIGIFSLPAAGLFSLSAPGNAGSPPEPHGASVGNRRGPWHVVWGFKVASNHGKAFRARRAIQAHANIRTILKKCPTAHVISRILKVVNVVRHYLVMERYSPTPTCETCDHSFTIRYNIHDLGRIVSSHARSCVEDMTTRWLGLHL